MDDEIHLTVPAEHRPQHIYVPGMTQQGKSTLLCNQILDDINFDRGVCVIDGKTDLVRKVVEWIPPRRAKDVIYIDQTISIAIDFMTYRDDSEQQKLIDEITFMYSHTTSPDHMPTIASNLDNIIHTLLSYNENKKFKTGQLNPLRKATFLDIYYFLTDAKRRDEITKNVVNPEFRDYWDNPENLPKGQDLHRLLSRMTKFKNSQPLRRIFDVPEPKLNIAQAIQDRKIILVELGRLTTTQLTFAHLLLAKIVQAFDRNMEIDEHKRVPFYLYCDEFHRFQTSDFADMLSRAGGLNLCLTLAHQFPKQITSAGVWDSIYRNVHTYFLFQMAPQDITTFQPYFPKLPRYEHHDEFQRLRSDWLSTARELAHMEVAWLTDPNVAYEKKLWAAERLELIGDHATPLVKRLHRIETRMADIGLPYPDPPDFAQELLRLPVGQAIYIDAARKAFKIKTPDPLDAHNPASCAPDIKKNMKTYQAETVNRMLYTKNNAHSSNQDKDGGEPEQTTRQPPNPHKEKRSKPPR
jgi:hypothetical protein